MRFIRACISHLGARSLGQSIVEFALVFPIFFVTLVGVMEMGRMMIDAVSVANAAREAARAGIISARPTGTLVTLARGYVLAVGPTPVVTIVIQNPSGTPYPGSPTRTSGDRISVTVAHTFQPLGGLLNDPSVTYSSTAVMTVE